MWTILCPGLYFYLKLQSVVKATDLDAVLETLRNQIIVFSRISWSILSLLGDQPKQPHENTS